MEVPRCTKGVEDMVILFGGSPVVNFMAAYNELSIMYAAAQPRDN